MVRIGANSGQMRDRLIAALLVMLALAAIAASTWLVLHRGGAPDVALGRPVKSGPAPPVIEPQLYKSLAPDDALAENAAIPFSAAPVERAPSLVLPLSAAQIAGRRSSIDCLTAAIYYEAGHESAAGKRGVAQVILNRVRHPAFPNTICGVVYQGSERKTGCQFTFTCDGSLARRPLRQGWEEARQIALAALSGAVEPRVGMATHYHADYVVPYWAASLAKITKLDHHIFYRWAGGWGRRVAFTQSVSQEQLLPDQPQIEAVSEIGLGPNALSPSANTILKSLPLVADEVAGAPLGDAGGGVAVAPASSPLAADGKRLKPAADDAGGRLKTE